MQYVDISNVDSLGATGDIAIYRLEDAPSRARRRVRDGDVIISTVRTYLQAIAEVHNPPANVIVSTGFAVVRPRREVFDANYCKYAIREPEFLAEVERRSVGVSYPAINASDLGSIPVHVHPLSHQRAIADYFDRETARLDALMAAKNRLLGLLADKRHALITHAVTRGLDPMPRCVIRASRGWARFRLTGECGRSRGSTAIETSEVNRACPCLRYRSTPGWSSASSRMSELRTQPRTSIPIRSHGMAMLSSTRCGCGRERLASLPKTVS